MFDKQTEPFNPFTVPPPGTEPEPPRTVPEALLRAYRAAWGDFREYLPHGVPVGEFDPTFIHSSVFGMAEDSVRQHLEPVLPTSILSDVVKSIAWAALVDCARHLADYEPNPPWYVGPATVDPFVRSETDSIPAAQLHLPGL